MQSQSGTFIFLVQIFREEIKFQKYQTIEYLKPAYDIISVS